MAEGRSANGADLLARVRGEIDERLAQLRPAVDEYAQLLGASDVLEPPAAAPAPVRPTAPVRPPAPVKRSAPVRPPAPVKRSARVKPPAPVRPPRAPAKRRAPASSRERPLGTAELAILAALEHGSHTVAELGVVTAMSGVEIRDGARRLLRAGRIVRASREGRAAYALSGRE
jgi:hypothetical protein